jgi:MFS family permease
LALKSKRPRIFYGWVLVAVSFLIMGVSTAAVYYSFGIFFQPMAAELGWPRGATATAFSIMIVVLGAIAPLVAALINRWGVRSVLGLGSILLVASILLMSIITQVWHLYLVYGVLVGIGMGSARFLTITTLINFWFIRRKALAIGIVMAGIGPATLVLAPVASHLIGIMGWRACWLVLAAIVFLLMSLPALILVRDKPEDIGELPDGAVTSTPTRASPSTSQADTAPRDWETKAALRTPTLWLFAVFTCSSFFAVNMLAVHQVAHLTDLGVPELAAAGALGMMVGTGALARVLGGLIGDRFDLRRVAAAACAMEVVAIVVLMNARTMPLIYAYVMVFGLASGWLGILPPALIGAYYGRKNYAPIFAAIFLVSTIVGAAGPMLAGFIFDATASYLIPFASAAAFCAAGAVCSLLARPPRLPGQTLTAPCSAGLN